MNEPTTIKIELELANRDDLYVLYHLMTGRHSEMTRRARRSPTDADREIMESAARRWFGYMTTIGQIYETVSEGMKNERQGK